MEVNSQYKEGLKIQLREAYGRIVYTYTTHLKKMNQLDKNNRLIKCVQIVLSAFSTTGFIGAIITNQVIMTCIAGIFSTASLFINLYFKDFNLAEESKQHRMAADNLWLIREQYLSLLTDINVLSEDEIIKKRDDLQKFTSEVYRRSPKTDAKSFKTAQRALKSEEEQFFKPEEIDGCF